MRFSGSDGPGPAARAPSPGRHGPTRGVPPGAAGRRRAPDEPSPSAGFTLIELMIVTVMLGILAMIAMPIYQNLRADAARGALQQQLRTLAQAQQMHFLERDVYTDDVSDLDYGPAQDLQLEMRMGGAGAGPGEGWSGRLTHPVYGVRCAVFYGDAEPYEPAVVEGEIACDGEA